MILWISCSVINYGIRNRIMDDLIEAIARKIQGYTGEYSEEVVKDIRTGKLVKDWELYKLDAKAIIDMVNSYKHTEEK